eukprot:INCI8311.2.p1 GENE.INCI8311.2~~INCI8311.2.p1  ORF type:complete len:1318 (-),score=204.71 INCI8311.2:9-3962(-)
MSAVDTHLGDRPSHAAPPPQLVHFGFLRVVLQKQSDGASWFERVFERKKLRVEVTARSITAYPQRGSHRLWSVPLVQVSKVELAQGTSGVFLLHTTEPISILDGSASKRKTAATLARARHRATHSGGSAHRTYGASEGRYQHASGNQSTGHGTNRKVLGDVVNCEAGSNSEAVVWKAKIEGAVQQSQAAAAKASRRGFINRLQREGFHLLDEVRKSTNKVLWAMRPATTGIVVGLHDHIKPTTAKRPACGFEPIDCCAVPTAPLGRQQGRIDHDNVLKPPFAAMSPAVAAFSQSSPNVLRSINQRRGTVGDDPAAQPLATRREVQASQVDSGSEGSFQSVESEGDTSSDEGADDPVPSSAAKKYLPRPTALKDERDNLMSQKWGNKANESANYGDEEAVSEADDDGMSSSSNSSTESVDVLDLSFRAVAHPKIDQILSASSTPLKLDGAHPGRPPVDVKPVVPASGISQGQANEKNTADAGDLTGARAAGQGRRGSLPESPVPLSAAEFCGTPDARVLRRHMSLTPTKAEMLVSRAEVLSAEKGMALKAATEKSASLQERFGFAAFPTEVPSSPKLGNEIESPLSPCGCEDRSQDTDGFGSRTSSVSTAAAAAAVRARSNTDILANELIFTESEMVDRFLPGQSDLLHTCVPVEYFESLDRMRAYCGAVYNAGSGKLILKDMLKRTLNDIHHQQKVFERQAAATDAEFGRSFLRPENLSPLIRSVRGNLRTVLREQEESLRSELTQLREEIMTAQHCVVKLKTHGDDFRRNISCVAGIIAFNPQFPVRFSDDNSTPRDERQPPVSPHAKEPIASESQNERSPWRLTSAHECGSTPADAKARSCASAPQKNSAPKPAAISDNKEHPDLFAATNHRNLAASVPNSLTDTSVSLSTCGALARGSNAWNTARRDYEQNFFPREPIHVVCGQVVSAHPVVLRNVEASRLVVGGERARLAAKAVGLSPTAVPFSPNKNAESRTFTWQSPEYTVGNVVHVRVAHHSAAHYGKKGLPSPSRAFWTPLLIRPGPAGDMASAEIVYGSDHQPSKDELHGTGSQPSADITGRRRLWRPYRGIESCSSDEGSDHEPDSDVERLDVETSSSRGQANDFPENNVDHVWVPGIITAARDCFQHSTFRQEYDVELLSQSGHGCKVLETRLRLALREFKPQGLSDEAIETALACVHLLHRDQISKFAEEAIYLLDHNTHNCFVRSSQAYGFPSIHASAAGSEAVQFATPLEFDAGLLMEYDVPAAVLRSTSAMMYEVYQGNPTADSLDICREMESSNFKIFQIAVESIVVVSSDPSKAPRLQRWFRHSQTKVAQ